MVCFILKIFPALIIFGAALVTCSLASTNFRLTLTIAWVCVSLLVLGTAVLAYVVIIEPNGIRECMESRHASS